jgi:hypothetical protein
LKFRSKTSSADIPGHNANYLAQPPEFPVLNGLVASPETAELVIAGFPLHFRKSV